MAQNFKIDTSDYLGISHTTFKNKLMEIALTKPSEYFQLREKVLERVKTNAIANLYNTIYLVLTEGKLNDGNLAAAGATQSAIFVPNYPKQKVTEIALSAAKTMDEIIDGIIEIILPIDYNDIAKQRISRKADANGIE